MSPSWREAIEILLAPGEVRVRVRPRPFARGGSRSHQVRFVPSADPAIALREAVAALGLGAFDAEVTLSNEYVRYAVVPDADALRNDAERRAAALHALAQTYGEAASAWQVAADAQGFDAAMLVAGVDAGLPASLAAALHELGARSVRVQPLLAQALDRCHSVLRHPGWLAVLEPQRIVLATLDAQGVASVRSQRVRSGVEEDLALLLEQARLLDAQPAQANRVVVYGDTGASGAVSLPGLAGFEVVAVEQGAAPARARTRRRIAMDFTGRRAPLRATEAAWLAAGLLALAGAGWHYGQLAGERATLQASLRDAERFARRDTPRAADPRAGDARALAAEVARANAVAARLNIPWESLFADLETAGGSGIVLTGFEPEAGMRRLKITGEAARYEDVTQYLRRLDATPTFQNVFLAGHELRERGLSFTLTADWARHEPPRP